ncbi:MAG: MASE3 domain-containing protein, partial [Candidatus Paceibacterota bacterium]
MKKTLLSRARAISAETYRYLVADLLVLLMFYSIGLNNYPLSCSLAELFSIVLMMIVSAIVWNARDYIQNNYLLFLGIALVFVAFIDLLFALFYAGSTLTIRNEETNLTAQLWIAARYLQAISLLVAPFFIGRRLRIDLVFTTYAGVLSVLLLSIFYWHIFPTSYIPEIGHTLFKTVSEVIITVLTLLSLIFLIRKRSAFDKNVFFLLCSFLVVSIFSETFFLLNEGAFEFSDVTGHLLKIAAFYLLYRAVAITGLTDPREQLLKSLEHKDEEIRANEQKFRLVVESSKDAFVTTNNEGNIVLWNKSAESIFGYREKEILGKPFALLGLRKLLILKDAAENTTEEVPSLEVDHLPEIGNKSIEMRGRRKGGEEFPLEISSSSWEYGQEMFFTSIIRDITRRKDSEHKLQEYAREIGEREARNEALLLSIADGIVVTDMSGRIVYCNNALKRISGLGPKELLHRDLDETIPFFDELGKRVPIERRPIYIAIDPRKRENLPISSSSTFYLVHKKSRRKVPLSINASPFVIDGTILGAIAVWRDITHEKEIDKAKSEFISFASHQLRTPLTSISLSIDMLLNHSDEPLTKVQKKYLRIAFGGIKDMTDIIETLLNISRIQMGTLVVNPEPVHLPDYVDTILKNISIAIRNRNIKIKRIYEPNLPDIKIDQRLMKIVLENLVSNAMKYSPLRSTILVEIKKQGKDAVIAVSDTGSG